MDQTFKNLLETLRKQSYAALPFPMKRAQLDQAMEAFLAFLNLPDNIKNHIDFKISKTHRRGDIGFKHRTGKDSIYDDSKDFLHYHPQIHNKYAGFLKENPVVNDLMEHAKPIWDLVYQTIEKALSSFEDDFPGVTSKILGKDNDHVMLRFLKYNWQSSGKYLAKPHYDAGSFTLCLAESDPGLRIGSGPNDMQPVDHAEEQALFMLSSNFKKIMDTDDLSAGWHDVIQTNENLIGKPYARWAIVAFIEAHDVEALSRAETHKWYTAKSA